LTYDVNRGFSVRLLCRARLSAGDWNIAEIDHRVLVDIKQATVASKNAKVRIGYFNWVVQRYAVNLSDEPVGPR